MSGHYSVKLTRKQGGEEVRQVAVNVPIGEGDLRLLNPDELQRRLAGVRYQFHHSRQMIAKERELAGFEISRSLLYALLIALLIEQILAYTSSYHPVVRGKGL